MNATLNQPIPLSVTFSVTYFWPTCNSGISTLKWPPLGCAANQWIKHLTSIYFLHHWDCLQSAIRSAWRLWNISGTASNDNDNISYNETNIMLYMYILYVWNYIYLVWWCCMKQVKHYNQQTPSNPHWIRMKPPKISTSPARPVELVSPLPWPQVDGWTRGC